MQALVQAFKSRRLFVVLLLGYSSGLPLALTGTLLQSWMKTLNIDITLIGLIGLASVPYTLKFVWAPLLDRYAPPFIKKGMGRRRGWILFTQVGLFLTVAALGLSRPDLDPSVTALIAVAVAFLSASQDIVIDAYKIELLKPREFGLGAATGILGYRLAMLVSGGVALILVDHLPYSTVYLLMASSLGIGILATLWGPEPPKAAPIKSLQEAFVLPFLDFFKRKGSLEIFLFILLYKLDVVIATALTTPFVMDLGFTKTDVGVITKTFGLLATIAGSLAGGTLMLTWGLHRSLWIFGIVQGVSTLTFLALAHVGHVYPVLVAAIAAENFFSGMGNVAYAAFLMSLCNPRFTASQNALLTSLMAFTRVFAGAFTGFLAKAVGWELYFVVATLAAIPSLLLLLRYPRWARPPERI